MWIRQSLSVAALLGTSCSAAHSVPQSTDRAAVAPVATNPVPAASITAAAALAPGMTTAAPPDYIPEPSIPINPLELPTLVWLPPGVTPSSGVKECRRWHAPLGKLCSAVGDPRQALVALAERA